MTLLGLTGSVISFITLVRGAQWTVDLGSSTWVAPGTFPTKAFSSYYNDPTSINEQPQPVINNPVTGQVFLLNLTDPKSLPKKNVIAHASASAQSGDESLLQDAYAQIMGLFSANATSKMECSLCLTGLETAQFLARHAPSAVPKLADLLCKRFSTAEYCRNYVDTASLGPIITQVLAAANVGGYDGQTICNNFLNGLCPLPSPVPLDLDKWFATPKPANAIAPTPSGERLKVLHLSDFHLDARYSTGAESNCTDYMCCRTDSSNAVSPNQVVLPAPRYGAFECDTPYALALAALEAIPEMTGTRDTGFDFSIFTGDLVSHDAGNEISQDYVEYEETALYTLFKKYLGGGPMYTAIGNHDTAPQAQDAPAFLGTDQFSWNYNNLAGLWEGNGWISSDIAEQARTHYGGYSVTRPDGLKIITLNTDLWYRWNFFNYINMDNPDASGILRFLTDELQDAEDKGLRVWILGHVLTGWDGSEPLNNPSNLFYQIVDRYTPHVIANIFFGHTHEDQLSIYYTNNGTAQTSENARAVSWIGPSITPLVNLNSGFRMYEVDAKTFDVLDAHTWFSNVSSYAALDGQTAQGPTWSYLYNTRQAYTQGFDWPTEAPLNATWWHKVTEAMEAQPSLVSLYNRYQGKNSVKTPPCTGNCAKARVCYMRSGSAPIAQQNCIPGYAYVQG